MTTVADCWTHYVRHHLSTTCDPATNGRYWGRLSWFGPKDAERLSPTEVDQYIAQRSIKPASVNRELALLRAALRHAEKHGIIARAPHIKAVPGATPRLRALSLDEAGRIVAAADAGGNWREQVYVRLALGTGARPGAVVDLKWSQVHSMQGSIDYRIAGLPISHRMKRRAVVPINKMVKQALRIAGQHRDGEYVLHWHGRKLSSPRPMMRRIAKRAKVKDCSPHVLRHTVASILLSQEVDLLKVSRLLGHSSSKVTETIYFQHPEGWLRRVTDKLEF
jgi:integrase